MDQVAVLHQFTRQQTYVDANVLVAGLASLAHLVSAALSKDADLLIQGLLLLLIVALNYLLHVRETGLAQGEMDARIQHTLQELEKCRSQDRVSSKVAFFIQESAFNTCSSIAMSRVVRPGQPEWIPSNLLVENDHILLAFGESAPAHVRYTLDPALDPLDLKRGHVLNPTFFAHHKPQASSSQGENGLFEFIVVKAPLAELIEQASKVGRPESMIAQYFTHIHRIANYILILNLVVSGVALSVRFVIDKHPIDQVHLVFLYTLTSLLPLLPIAFPVLILVARTYANSLIIALFDGLQRSKTEFRDMDDVDEFDAVPAPTKDIKVGWGAIWAEFKDQMMMKQGKAGESKFLARTGGLVESLGNASVLCALDREGTISSVFLVNSDTAECRSSVVYQRCRADCA